MKRILGLLGAVGVLSLAAPSQAHATLTSPLCVTFSGFTACAGIQVVGTTVTITNLGSTPNGTFVITGFGFYSFDAGDPNASFSGVPLGWAPQTTLPCTSASCTPAELNGILSGEVWHGGAETTQGVNNGVVFGAPREFTLSSGIDFTNLQWAWRANAWTTSGAGGFTGQSIKCYQTGAASIGTCGPTTVIPEPGSMVLLATGLIGLGGMGFIRRRKQA